ncbi:hypothetical protein CHS0354_042221 [Potamilus streckersoni]|uniref:Uncharacterized protein n=1 Tax=Potamilus streckersoni TaxID=2493646 RepID=A0AAE0TLR5_9BIVA|nr:hypothetical protein CHS0354_042221 [Potamilus streckersoni]
MATLTMEQDPDLKRFIEDRKQRYYDNDKAAVFATSLPLSNNGVEDRRSQLRDERHRDYQRYLERSPANSKQSSANSKQSSTKQAVYYRMDSPERGLPLGNYDLVKEKLSQERHQDYKNYLKKKHQDESERNRTRYSPSRPQAPSQPRLGDIDYSQMKQELSDERKRDYQDYLQQQEHMYVRAQQENGIPVLDRTPREDNSYVTSKPPPGPGANRQREEPTRQTPHYWDEGRPVRSPQSFDSQPGQRNDPTEHSPKGYQSGLPPPTRNRDLNLNAELPPKTPQANFDSRHRNIGPEDQVQLNLALQTPPPHPLQSQSPHGAPPAQQSQRRTPLALQTGYRPSTPSVPHRGNLPPNLDFPYGYGYEEMRKKAIGERHRDYQEYLKRESERYRPHADELPPPGPSDFPKGHHYSSDEYEKYRKDLQQKQQAEYQDFLQKKQMSDPPRFGRNTPPVVGPYSGIFAGLGQYDLDKQRLKKERQSEYSNFLDKTYAEKGRPYGRPTWAKGIDDNEQYPARPYSYEHQSNPETKPRDHLPPIEGQGQGERRPPSYEDMLAKKRQVEADRRRYDPGFAPRDDRYEAERSGPPRDGDYAPRDGGYGGDGNQGQDRYRY